MSSNGNGKRKNGKRPGGRPTLYRPEFAEQAFRLCLVGHTNEELAKAFGVDVTTIDLWLKTHSEFSGAVKAGREEADGDVAQSLYRRAMGAGDTPPDTAACIFWLKNRQRLKWRDKHDIEHAGKIEIEGPSPDEVWAALERVKTQEELGRLLRANGHAR